MTELVLFVLSGRGRDRNSSFRSKRRGEGWREFLLSSAEGAGTELACFSIAGAWCGSGLLVFIR